MTLFFEKDLPTDTHFSGLEWLNSLEDSELLTLFSSSYEIDTVNMIPRNQNIKNHYEIIFSGCSETHGDYLTDDGENYDGKDIWGFLLSKYLKKSAINLGLGGSSIYEIIKNILKYIDINKKPEKIFCLFPDLNRLNTPNDPGVLINKNKENYIGVYPLVSVATQATKFLPKFSKMPHIKEEVIPRIIPVWLNIQSILVLEKFCKICNIELYYSTWSLQTDRILQGITSLEHKNNIEPSFSGYISSDPDSWLYGKLHKVCSRRHKVNLDIHHKYYDSGKDNLHMGAHEHAHMAEIFIEKLDKV